MKYSIKINQIALNKFFPSLDIIDGALINYLSDFANTGKMETVWYEGKPYYWIKYSSVIKQMPCLKIKSGEVIGRRFRNIAAEGILQAHPDNKAMRRAYYAFGGQYHKLVMSGAEAEKTKPISSIKNDSKVTQYEANRQKAAENDPELPISSSLNDSKVEVLRLESSSSDLLKSSSDKYIYDKSIKDEGKENLKNFQTPPHPPVIKNLTKDFLSGPELYEQLRAWIKDNIGQWRGMLDYSGANKRYNSDEVTEIMKEFCNHYATEHAGQHIRLSRGDFHHFISKANNWLTTNHKKSWNRPDNKRKNSHPASSGVISRYFTNKESETLAEHNMWLRDGKPTPVVVTKDPGAKKSRPVTLAEFEKTGLSRFEA